MAYQIKKADKITEDLELLDKDNNVTLIVHVDIEVGKIAKEYRQIQVRNSLKMVMNKLLKVLEIQL